MFRKLKESLSSLSLSRKFFLSLLFLLTLFSALISLIFYFYLKERLLNQTYEKLQLFYLQMEALEHYVKKELRPALWDILKKSFRENEFIVEGMSTTHIKKRLYEYLKSNYPEVSFERISLNPLNPENSFKKEHYLFLEKVKEKGYFQGLMKLEEGEFLVYVKPIYAEKGCLACHGRLRDMPHQLVERYQLKKDFPWKEGDLMGIEVVKIPLKEALSDIKALSISIFTISLLASLFLLVSLEGVFYTLILRPIRAIRDHLRKIREGSLPLHTPLNLEQKDEFGELAYSMNKFLSHLSQVQKALLENLETLETLLESITHPIALINSNCEVEISNKAYQSFPYQECYKELLLKVFALKKSLTETIETEDGKIYQLFLYPVFNENQEVKRAVLLFEDITERKRMEERLILTEKLAAVGQLAAGLAHEINNPLSGILLMVNHLKKNNLPKEEKETYLEYIREGLLRIQRLLQDLLNFSRNREIKKQLVSINALLEETLELCSYLFDKNGISLVKELSSNLPPLFLDKDKMQQVFLNLILNAIQAMENSEKKLLFVRTYLKDNKVFISIEDTGPGVPEEIRTRIFDPFFTTKPPGKGTGLGLTVSLAIVESHGGRIYLEKGACGANFIVELPLS